MFAIYVVLPAELDPKPHSPFVEFLPTWAIITDWLNICLGSGLCDTLTSLLASTQGQGEMQTRALAQTCKYFPLPVQPCKPILSALKLLISTGFLFSFL